MRQVRLLWSVGTVVLLGLVLLPPALGQRKKRAMEELPEPQQVDFTTEDGVLIAGVYYPSTEGREAVPVMLLHAFGRNYNDYEPLLDPLQRAGFAVLIFDFRGHGHSTRFDPSVVPQVPGRPAPTLNYKTFRPEELSWMVRDVEAAKQFLLRRHNKGELNIGKLCLIGAELGATIAAHWALYDWKAPPVGLTRAGQDVRTLVLLSPRLNYRGLRIDEPLRELQKVIPILVVYGRRDEEAARDVERIWRLIQPGRSTKKEGALSPQPIALDTRVQGTHLLNPELNFKLDEIIIRFLSTRVRPLRIEWEPRGDLKSE
jgi:hypothetical protein